MGTEIERKFLVDPEKLPVCFNSYYIRQTYVVSQPDISVRVRVCDAIDPQAVGMWGSHATIGIKIGAGPIRTELEYEIDYKELEVFLSNYPSVRKIRHIFYVGDDIWEVDKFLDRHEGLWLAEIELDSLDQELELPDWVGEEVTWDAEYYNCNLAEKC